MFRPVRPMLAGKLTINEIAAKVDRELGGRGILVETKYDGERIQAHIQDKVVRFYSRNAKDYTYLYGP